MSIIEEIIKIKLYRLGFWRIVFLFSVSIILTWILWLFLSINYQSIILAAPDFLITLLVFLTSALLFVLVVEVYERIQPLFEFHRRNKTIDGIPQIHKWIYQGSLNIRDSLEITSSNSGCLIRDNFYKDFTLSCKLKIINGGGVGIIFRAQDLENYLMLQIGLQDENKEKDIKDGQIALTPHIRFLGNFETYNIQNHEPFYDTKKAFNSDGEKIWLSVKNLEVLLKIKEKEFRWNIPTNTEVNIIQYANQAIYDSHNPKIWFRNHYGKIGFRAFGLERAIISNLRVEKL